MRFVFYKNGKKYIVTNATVYEAGDAFEHNFIITSTRGSIANDAEIENQTVLDEIREGIAWNHEIVN